MKKIVRFSGPADFDNDYGRRVISYELVPGWAPLLCYNIKSVDFNTAGRIVRFETSSHVYVYVPGGWK